MSIILNSALKQWIVLIPLWALSAHMGWTMIIRFLAEECVRRGADGERLEAAVSWDEANPVYHYYIGRLHHYGIDALDLERAIASYRRAIRLSPLVAGYWLHLGKACEEAKRPAEAEHAFAMAVQLNARSPQVRWEAANFWLRQGNLDQAFAHFKAAAEFNDSRLSSTIALGWKVTADRERLLRQVVPNTAIGNLTFLNFALGKGDYVTAARAWARLLENEAPGFRADQAFLYIDALVQDGQVAQAERVWGQALAKSGLDEKGPARAPADNLVYNGSFEKESLNGGFDWRTVAGTGFWLSLDSDNRLGDYHSLRIEFDGKSNMDFYHLYQIVPLTRARPASPPVAGGPARWRPVASDRHRVSFLPPYAPAAQAEKDHSASGERRLTLRYSIKTQEVSTDQGVYWEIAGYPGNHGILARSRQHRGTEPWTRGALEFTVPAAVPSVLIRLRRLPSQKIDNLLKGKIWLDEMALHGEPPAGPEPK